MLFCAFPPLGWDFLAWIALCPLVFIALASPPKTAFVCGLVSGLVFWLGSIFWLTRVSYAGWFSVSLYCALYSGVFAGAAAWWLRRLEKFNIQLSTPNLEGMGVRSKLKVSAVLILLFGIPALWVALEYARSILCSGFPWNLVGVSQYLRIRLIQCADIGGVYMVSYLVLAANVLPALLFAVRGAGARAVITPLLAFASALLLLLGYGSWRLSQKPVDGGSILAAAIQLNVPQEQKFSESAVADIYRRLDEAVSVSARSPRPDLVVWPETALPDFWRYSSQSRDAIARSRACGIPLLAGAMDYEAAPGRTNFFNSSFFFDAAGEQWISYAKRHLVPFGEYVPLVRFFPFLKDITGLEENFTPGAGSVVFSLGNGGGSFAVLICFEDIMPYLARDAARTGARLLVNQTNDAWFDPFWAQRQHAAHCVFRCVENRLACLRSANTGLTCYIDRLGVVRASIAPAARAGRKHPDVLKTKVAFASPRERLTFYTRHGDLFALACVAFSIPVLLGFLLASAARIARGGKRKPEECWDALKA